MTKVPQATIIFCGRNDNHNGDFDSRALKAQKYNYDLLLTNEIDFEQIYIEWNPLSHKEFFAEKLKKINPNIRSYIVSQKIHNHFCDNPNLNVLQFFAKNIGAIKAKAKTLLITNADTYLSRDVIQRIKLSVPDNKLYLYNRLDLNQNLLKKEIIREEDLIDPKNIVTNHPIEPPFYYGAAGDLMLIQKDCFRRVTGFNEDIRFSSIHIDTLFCKNLEYHNVEIIHDGTIYHIDHQDSFVNSKDDNQNHNGSNFEWSRIQLPYHNDTWGLADAHEESDNLNNIHLTLPEKKLRKSSIKNVYSPACCISANDFAKRFLESLELLIHTNARVMLYGFGNELRNAREAGHLKNLNIVGCIDDNTEKIPDMDISVFKFHEAKLIDFDAVLIGTAWWSNKLIIKAVEEWGTGKVFPMNQGSFVINYILNKNLTPVSQET